MFQQLNFFAQERTTAPSSVKGCTLIYEPKGRAREYATLACNVYRGCDHQCVYCYAPSATRRSAADFAASTTRGDKFTGKLALEAKKYMDAGITGQVLLSFTCDPYQHLDVKEKVTRRAIQILHHAGLDVQMLTKGGSRALRDLDLFTPRDAFATTLTFWDDEGQWRDWEPHAAPPSDRIATIQRFHAAGIPTWISLEPVLDPGAALQIIQRTHQFVDLFKVGKLNYENKLPPHLRERVKDIHWGQFARDAIDLLESLGYTRVLSNDAGRADRHVMGYYIKKDLRTYLSTSVTTSRPWPLGVWLRAHTNSLRDDNSTVIGKLNRYGLDPDGQTIVALKNAVTGAIVPISRVVGVVSPVDGRPCTGFPKVCPTSRADPVLATNCDGCEHRQRDQRGHWRCDHVGYQAAPGAHFCLDCGIKLGPYAEARGWERCGSTRCRKQEGKERLLCLRK